MERECKHTFSMSMQVPEAIPKPSPKLQRAQLTTPFRLPTHIRMMWSNIINSCLNCCWLQQHSPKKNLIRAILKSPKFLIAIIFISGFIFMLEIRVKFDPKSVHHFPTPCFIPQKNISTTSSSLFPVTPTSIFSQENTSTSPPPLQSPAPRSFSFSQESASTSPSPLQFPATPSFMFPQESASTSPSPLQFPATPSFMVSQESASTSPPPLQFPAPPSFIFSQENASSRLGSMLSMNMKYDGKAVGVQDGGFWEQPKGGRYRPCLGMSDRYKRESGGIVGERRKYLLVLVNGGLNQQRNQVVDAVVVARILGAVLVVPIFELNAIWADESEFSDIFDLEHFKSVLENDVRIVSSLPATHITVRPMVQTPTPRMSAELIRSTYLPLYARYPVLMLRAFEASVATNLPDDLQKLRCKVAFHALKFTPRILELGNKLTERMRRNGPYLSLHLRMEQDVWVRNRCLPGLTREYNKIIRKARKAHPDLLSYRDKRLAGLCPMNALEVTRLLKALGAPQSANIYWAGGIPLGGKEALKPLIKEFPYFYSKEDLAFPGELEPLANKSSLMAAIDYIICENSDVFMASHGGNMGHALQGQRAYMGHKKTIVPNKRSMMPYFMNRSIPEAEFNKIILDLHKHHLGQPVRRSGRPVTKYPIPECMCKDKNKYFTT